MMEKSKGLWVGLAVLCFVACRVFDFDNTPSFAPGAVILGEKSLLAN